MFGGRVVDTMLECHLQAVMQSPCRVTLPVFELIRSELKKRKQRLSRAIQDRMAFLIGHPSSGLGGSSGQGGV